MKKLAIYFENEEREVTFSGQDSLLEALLEQDVPVNHSCEGMASCGTCRILVTEGLEELPERNALEQEMAEDRQFSSKERLSCQLCPTHPLRFRLPTD